MIKEKKSLFENLIFLNRMKKDFISLKNCACNINKIYVLFRTRDLSSRDESFVNNCKENLNKERKNFELFLNKKNENVNNGFKIIKETKNRIDEFNAKYITKKISLDYPFESGDIKSVMTELCNTNTQCVEEIKTSITNKK
jgi:hypothetical protein